MSATAVAGFTPLDEALRRLEGACSPVTGIVTHVVRTMHGADHASIPNHACRLASARRTLGGATVDYGSGAAESHARARAAALGEAVERYSATYLPTSRLLRTTARALGGRAVPPGRFALFHAAQLGHPSFPFASFSEDTELDFVEGVSLADGAPAFAPAALVFLRPPPSTAPPIAYPTSSGLACAPTAREAALAALLELVERDAVMLAWNARLSLPRIAWESDPIACTLADRFFDPTGLRYGVVSGSMFLHVPVAIAIVHGAPGSGAALAVGAGCAADPRDAWLKALSESFGVHRGSARSQRARSTVLRRRPSRCRRSTTTCCSTRATRRPPRRVPRRVAGDLRPRRPPLARGIDARGAPPRARGAARPERHRRYAFDVTAPDVARSGSAWSA